MRTCDRVHVSLATACGRVRYIHDASQQLFTCAATPRCIGAVVHDFRLSWPPVYSVLFMVECTPDSTPESSSLESRNEGQDTARNSTSVNAAENRNQALKSPWIVIRLSELQTFNRRASFRRGKARSGSVGIKSTKRRKFDYDES